VVGAPRFEALVSVHRRGRFDCGVPTLNRYLRELATQDVRRGVASCFVALDADDAIIGFYTLAAAHIPLQDLLPEIARRLPRYPMVPAARVGRLAVDLSRQRQSVGGFLLIDAIGRTIRSEVAASALLVDAKDDAAEAFYRRQGFEALASAPGSLFLMLDTARRLKP
jgi:GNAT superfamily N-acetyltransferase